jgi:hypothetical protein
MAFYFVYNFSVLVPNINKSDPRIIRSHHDCIWVQKLDSGDLSTARELPSPVPAAYYLEKGQLSRGSH